jgi:hypothetical protein
VAERASEIWALNHPFKETAKPNMISPNPFSSYLSTDSVSYRLCAVSQGADELGGSGEELAELSAKVRELTSLQQDLLQQVLTNTDTNIKDVIQGRDSSCQYGFSIICNCNIRFGLFV